MNIHKAYSTAIVALLLTAASSAQTLFTYDFTGTTSDTSGAEGFTGDSSENLVFSNFTASGVSASNTAGNVWSFSSWTGGSGGGEPFSGGIELTDYFEFSVTPETGYEMTLTSITLDAGRTSTGPRQFVIRSSADGFATNLSASATNPNVSIVGSNIFQFSDNPSTAIYSGNSVTLSGITSQTSVVTFRIYAFNAENTGAGAFRVDNVTIMGSSAVSPVPEPASFGFLAGLGVMGLAAGRRRQRRATAA